MVLRSFRTATFLAAVALLSGSWIAAQDVNYTQEQYSEYTEAVNTPNPQAREDAILAFVEKYPDLSLVQYAIGEYGKIIDSYAKSGAHADLIRSGEKFMKLQPDNVALMSYIARSAYTLQQYDKAAEYGEKVNAASPSAGINWILTDSYFRLKQMPQFLNYADVTLGELDTASPQALELATRLRSYYIGEDDLPNGAKYATKVLTTLGSIQKSPSVSEADWKKYVDQEATVSRLIVARNDFDNERYSKAQPNFEKVLAINRDKKVRAECFYYVGMIAWRENDYEPAMVAFAKGSVQSGAPHASACETHLVNLYKSTHNGSVAGLQEYVQRVTGSE